MEVVNVPPRREPPDPKIPRVFLKSTQYTPAHKLVIAEMLFRQGTANFFRASYQQIATAVGLSRRHVIRIVDDLAKRRDVNITKHGTLDVCSFSLRYANNRNRRRREWNADHPIEEAS